MTETHEQWGAWNYPNRKRPESALEFCENMIACLERASDHERDEYWHLAMDAYIAKREELRTRFGIKPAAPAPRQLELLG